MPLKWTELSATPEFKSLPAEEQEKSRVGYFDQHIAPTVTADRIPGLRQEWDVRTLPKPADPAANAANANTTSPTTLTRPATASQAVPSNAATLERPGPAPTKGGPGFVEGVKDFGRGLVAGTVQNIPDSAAGLVDYADTPEFDSAGKNLGDEGAYSKWARDTREKGAELAKDWQQSEFGRQMAEHDAFSVRGAAYEAGKNLPLSFGPGLAGAAVGGAVAGLPGAVGGFVLGSIAALPLFFGSAAKDTYDRVYKQTRDTNPDLTDDQVHDEAMKAGGLTGSIEAGGELAADLVGAKLFKMIPSGAQKHLVKAATKGFQGVVPMVKEIAKVVGTEVGTELAQGAGQSEVEKAYGVGEGATWDNQKGVIMPTVLMTLIGGGAAVGMSANMRYRNAKLLQNPNTPPEQRLAAAESVAQVLRGQDPELANLFYQSAATQIQAGKPVIPQDDRFYRDLKPLDQREIDKRMAAGDFSDPDENPADIDKADSIQPTDINTIDFSGMGQEKPKWGGEYVESKPAATDTLPSGRPRPTGAPAIPRANEKAAPLGESSPESAQIAQSDENPNEINQQIGQKTGRETGEPVAQAMTRPERQKHMAEIGAQLKVVRMERNAADKAGNEGAVAELDNEIRAIGANFKRVSNGLPPENTPRQAKAQAEIGTTPPAVPEIEPVKDISAENVPLTSEIESTIPAVDTQVSAPEIPVSETEPEVTAGQIITTAEQADVIPSAATSAASVESQQSAQQEAATTAAERPAILTKSKKRYLTDSLTEQGIKKKSPGYDAAYARAEDQYEDEMDRAQAALPFADFHKLNSESPESINRSAWTQLRQEFGILDANDEAPAMDSVKVAADQAASSPNNDLAEPTDAQKDAGNYKKGHVLWNSMDISIETPTGAKRRPEWPELKDHYGYIKRTKGADGDHVDVFVNPDENRTDTVFVIDQRKKNGNKGDFDEHKVMLGYKDKAAAIVAYKRNYHKGWGVGDVTEMTAAEFKEWLANGDTTKEASKYQAGTSTTAATNEGENVDLTPADTVTDAAEKPSASTSKALEIYEQPGLQIEISGKRYSIASLAEAATKFSEARDRIFDGGGTSDDVPTPKILDASGKQIAYISQNGRIWEGKAEDWTSKTKEFPGPYARMKADVTDATDEQADKPAETIATETQKPPAKTRKAKDDERTPRQIEREAYEFAVSMADIQAAATGDRAAFDAKAKELLTAGGHGQFASDAKFLDAVYKEAKKRQKEAELEKNRDPAIYNAQLELATTAAELPEGEAEDFKMGFDHALAGRTKSTITGESKLKGYEAARTWMKTPEGKAFFKGERVNKLKNTGADLRRWFDKAKADMEAADGDWRAVMKVLKKTTERASLFRPDLDGATPGTQRLADLIRHHLRPFSEYLEARSSIWKRRRDTFDSMIERHFEDASPEVFEQRLAETKRLAAEYVESMRAISEGLSGAKTILELSGKIGTAIIAETDSYYPTLKHRDIADSKSARAIVALMPGSADNQWSQLYHLLQGEQTESAGNTNRKTPLTRPRLDRVTRTGRKDYRGGKDVTPEEVKAKFGLADVGFGEWVGARQDQDHLNYAYDAFMDLADVLGIKPVDIGLGGTLYFTIGALGHGKHAAHYQAFQEHPDGGTVPVINVTNTRGDGTVGHEWFHALDFALRGPDRGGMDNRFNQKGAVATVVAKLKADYDKASIDKAIKQFIEGSWFYKGVGIKKDDRVGQARYAIENGSYGRPQSTRYKINADTLGEDYWGNPNELFARMGEAYVYDLMAETANTYLVTDWVADSKVTDASYRGTPYPQGEERARFTALFDALFDSIEFTAEGPKFLETNKIEALSKQTREDFNKYKEEKLAELPALLKEVKKARAGDRGPAADNNDDADRLIAEQQRREQQRLEMEAAEAQQRPAEITSDTALSEDELSALFDDAAAELRESIQEQPEVPDPGERVIVADKPPPGGWTDADKVPEQYRKGNIVPKRTEDGGVQYVAEPQQTASGLALEAAKLGVKGIDEALTGLSKLFGGPNTLRSFPGGLDEKTYAEAKPHFQAALKAFVEAGKTIKDLFKFLIQNFGEGVKPYAVHFAREQGLGTDLATNQTQADTKGSEDNDVPASQTTDEDNRAGDAGPSTGDARTPEKERDAAGGPAGTGDSGEGVVPGSGWDGVDGGRAGPPEATPPGTDRGNGEERADSSGNRPGPSNRVSERKRSGLNYRATPGSLKREGSWRASAARNLDVLALIKKLQAEDRQATAEEQAQIVKFTGWGASEISQNLFPGRDEYAKPEWQDLVKRRAELMNDEEKRAASRSTQYAHYTSEDVIRGIWTGLESMGFQGGTILEPGMGVGLFPAAAPESIMDRSRYTGVEFDPFTARIATQLFQKENIIEGDYSKTKLPKDFFDLAIGNPPFGKVAILNDPEYAKLRFPLHDYFFAKTVDRVRPGGLLVFVTSRYTMDKQNNRARKYLADRADLLGAIRLPQTAFKDNAGTEVVTDILFMRKRAQGEAPAGETWMASTEQKIEGQQASFKAPSVNEYFQAHPEMVLGTPALAGTMYSKNEYTVLPPEGSIEDALAAAIKTLPRDVYTPRTDSKALIKESIERDFNPKSKKEGSVYVSDKGDLMRVDAGSGVGLADQLTKPLTAKEQAWMKDYVGLRDAVKQAQSDQLTEGEWEKSLKALNKTYDAFVKKHGQINAFTKTERTRIDKDTGESKQSVSTRRHNSKLLLLDVEHALVSALETISEDDTISKSNFLGGRTIKKPERREVNTVNDALMVSLDERGGLDLDFIAQTLGKEREAIIKDLGDLIYEAPNGSWQMGDEYLSGDVVTKLEEAEAAAAIDDKYQRNVLALIKVQPKPLGPRDITVQLGAAWVPVEAYQDFASEVMELDFSITHVPASNTWSIEGSGSRRARQDLSDWGTPDRSPAELLEAALLGKDVKVTRTVKEDGRTRTYTDQDATAAANEKLKLMKEAFSRWVWQDSKRGERMAALYNRLFNNLAPRTFDGSHLTLPGLSLKYKIYDHQKRAIWRVVQTGNTYLAHAVGAGKTLEMVIAGMEMKRLGLISKPIYAVPKKMLTQFASEFLDAYPTANILVADDENFDKANRGRFVAQAALNNPDAIIITHPAFTKLNVKDETRQRVANRFIGELQMAIEAEDDRFRRKEMEAQLERLERRFEGKAGKGSKDDVIDFEDLGADFLFMDEAHEYRKLDFISRRGNIKGIDPNGSAMALDLFIKIQHLENLRPGRAAVLASGTPVVNTIAEIYSIMRMLNISQLETDGLDHFDVWANQFGDVRKELEQNAAGQYEFVERFAQFVNVPELMKRVRSFMDVLTSSQLGELVQRPDLEGNQPNLIITPASDRLSAYLQTDLANRITAARAWKPSPGEPHNPDPLIAIISDGRLAGIDMRYVDPTLKDDPESKLNRMLDEIIVKHKAIQGRTYTDKETGNKDLIQGGTQIVFSSVGFGEMVMRSRGFDVKGEIIRRLTDGGIKRNQIAFMDEYSTDAKKAQLFKDMRAGKVRVLFGSPKNMGTGLNVQKRLSHLHYLSPPWYPADVEQPHGRILRQGNQNSTVGIDWYATKGTYDSTMWQMVARKQKFIEQAFTGDDSVRKLEDVSESSQYEMASALSSGDQRAIQLAGLNADVERLTRLQNAHADEQGTYRGRKSSAEFMLKRSQEKIARYEKALAEVGDYTAEMSVVSGDKTLTDRVEAGEFIRAEMVRVMAAWDIEGAKTDKEANKSAPEVEIAKVQGKYPLIVEGVARPTLSGDVVKSVDLTLVLPEGIEQEIEGVQREPESLDPAGLYTRVRNKLNSLSSTLSEERRYTADKQDEIAKLNTRIGARFQFETDLFEKKAEVEQLKGELAGENKDKEAAQDAPLTGGNFRVSESTPEQRATAMAKMKGVQQIVDKIGGNWNIDVRVIPTMAELPPVAQGELRRQRITSGVTGYYNGDSQIIYLVASAMRNKYDAQKTLLHEAVGHMGIERVMGEEIDTFLRTVYDARESDPTIKKAWEYVNQEHTYGNAGPIVQAAEMVARISESDPKHNLVQRFIQLVRQLLRKLGFTVPFKNDDIIEVLRRAKLALKDGSYTGTGSEGGLFQAAHHGTHKRGIEKFSTDYIGTGEGTQAYGYGLYFAQKTDVANYYRDLSQGGMELFYQGKPAQDAIENERARSHLANMASEMETMGTGFNDAKQLALSDIQSRREYAKKNHPEDVPDIDEAITIIRGMKEGDVSLHKKGALYTVDVPEDYELLDWDATIENQPPDVLEKLKPAVDLLRNANHNGVTYRQPIESGVLVGEGLYGGLSKELGSDKAASLYLKSLGIPGLRFFDHMSRHQPPPVPAFTAWAGYYKGADLDAISDAEMADLRDEYNEFVNAEDTRTRNFVIFDEDRIEITDTLFRVSEETRQAYEQRIDDLFAGESSRAKGIRILDRSDVLDLLGFGDQPLHLEESAVQKRDKKTYKVLHPGMTAEIWKRVPKWIENPVAVFKSQSVTGALVMFGPELVNGRPVRITMVPNKGMAGMDVHVTTNAYEESGTGTTPVDAWTHDKKALLYLDQKESPAFSERSGLRLPGEVRQLRGYKHRVMTDTDLVKYRAMEGGSGNFRTQDESDPEEQARRPLRATLNDRLDAIRYQMQDKLIDLKRIQEEADPADHANAYQKASIWEGKAGERLADFDDARVQPLLNLIAQTGESWDDVGNWLVARHAKEANAYLYEINFSESKKQAQLAAATARRIQIKAEMDHIYKTIPGPWETDPAYIAKQSEHKKLTSLLSSLKARKAIPENEAHRLSGMSNERAAEILDQHSNNRSLWAVGEMVDRINRERVEMLVEDGLIAPGMARAWQGRYMHYVPLKREEAEGADHLPARGQGFNISGKESRMRTGHADWTPGKIVANVIAQHESSIVRAEKNKVGQALLEFVKQHPDDSFWTVDTARTVKSVRNGQVIESPRFWDSPNELTVKQDGVEHTIVFNPGNPRAMRLVSGMKNLQAAEMGTVMRAMANVTRFLATINTSWNPEFMVANFARDIQTAAYNLSDTDIADMRGRVIKDVPAAMNGIRSALFGDSSSEWAPIWEDFRKAGGKTGWMDIHGDILQKEQDLKEMAERLAEGKPSRGNVKRFLKGVENMNNVIENGVRLSAYKNALDAGLSKDRAAALAKDLTVNFNRKGSMGPTINAMYMFFNAAVQGNVRLIQTMANSSKGRALAYATIGFAVALDILNRSLSGDDDDDENIYDTLPDYVKDRNIIIMGEKEPIVKIPAPWGYNVLHVIGQVIGQAMTGERFSAIDSASRVALSIMDAFNPVGSGTIAQVISPTITDPIVQMAENKNFAGNPLKPEHTFDARVPKPEYQMHWSTTREASKAIAKFLNDASGGNEVRPGSINISPEWIDTILDTATGGLGATVANTVDTATRFASGKDMPTENIPFVRKVTGYNNEYGIKGRYYEWSKGVAYAKSEIKHLRGAELIEARKNPEYRLVPLFTATEKELTGMRKLRRDMVDRGASEDKIEKLDERIRTVMARFNQEYAEKVLQ